MTTYLTFDSSTMLWHLDAISLTTAREYGLTETGRDVDVIILDTRPQLSHPFLIDSNVELYILDSQEPEALPKLKKLPREEFPSLTMHQTHPHGTGVLGLLCGKELGIAQNVNVFYICLDAKHGREGLSCDEQTIRKALSALAQNHELSQTLLNFSIILTSCDDDFEHLFLTFESYGCLFFASSGNKGVSQPTFPAALHDIISVGSCDENRIIPEYSGSGKTRNGENFPLLIAPGEGIYSTTTGGVWKRCSGTSFATPVLVGIAALFWEQDPFLTAPELRELLVQPVSPSQTPPKKDRATASSKSIRQKLLPKKQTHHNL